MSKAKGTKNKKIAKATALVEVDFKLVEGEAKRTPPAQSLASTSRRNLSAIIERSDKYKNIEDGLTPFKSEASGRISISEAVELCQKAYYNIPVFRNVIELMVELSTNHLYYRGGSEKSRKFISTYLDKIIKVFSLQDKFFREYYRGGNVWVLRHDAKLKDSDIRNMMQTFGVSMASTELPIKFSILNPMDMRFVGCYSFLSGSYEKVLNDYEIAQLKNQRTKEDTAYFKSLPKDIQKQIMEGAPSISIPIDPEYIYSIFYKKQDYEPFSVPMGYGVLGDLSYKEELKKMDMALARTIQQVILLVTTGNEPDKGGINQNHIEKLNQILQNQSIGRVLVADYTTKAEFVIPQIADILNPDKYKIVNEDIMLGLHNILVGDEKFANQSIKVQLFIEKLRQARKAFLDDFLIPEIKRICEVMGFKNYPTPYFEEFDLKNEVELARIYTRLAEIGILTPSETLTAIETGVLPDKETSLVNQNEFKKQKDDGLYWPVAVTGPEDPAPNGVGGGSGGRPPGTKRKQSTKKISPIGASIDLNQVTATLKIASSLEDIVTKEIKSLHKLRKLSEDKQAIISEICLNIIANENVSDWAIKAKEYAKEPRDMLENKKDAISEFAEYHDLDFYNAALLIQCKK